MTTRLYKTARREIGFTLIEVLTVVGIITLLLAMLLPGLSAARGQAKGVLCRSNIRQIAIANGYYADDNNGVYCPGAAGFLENLHRWHGARDHPSESFDSRRGPFVPYLGPEETIRQCPAFEAAEIALQSGGFECGNGGYGYNNAFIGVQLGRSRTGEYTVMEDRAGAPADWVQRPAETVMFTDSAFAAAALIEYSFAEPRFHPQFPEFRTDPSIHFRHRDQSNVAWCDGHVDPRKRTLTWSSGLYPTDPERFSIGWFGQTDDNSLFDLR